MSSSNPPDDRQSGFKGYPYGVVTGGMIIEMATWLSRSTNWRDWDLSYQIQSKYVDSFVRINRMDGIVVESKEETFWLTEAFKRYLDIYDPMPIDEESERLDPELPPQILWVPGFEPTIFVPFFLRDVVKVEDPKRLRKPFDAADMYARRGERKGRFLGYHKDLKNWERMLWAVPRDIQAEESGPHDTKDSAMDKAMTPEEIPQDSRNTVTDEIIVTEEDTRDERDIALSEATVEAHGIRHATSEATVSDGHDERDMDETMKSNENTDDGNNHEARQELSEPSETNDKGFEGFEGLSTAVPNASPGRQRDGSHRNSNPLLSSPPTISPISTRRSSLRSGSRFLNPRQWLG